MATFTRSDDLRGAEFTGTLSCLHTILEEEWEHHRYAVRDLDAIEADPGRGSGRGVPGGGGGS